MADMPSVGQIADQGDPKNPSMAIAQKLSVACAGLYYAFDAVTGGNEVADRYSFGFMRMASDLTGKLSNNNNIDHDYMNTISRYANLYSDILLTKGITNLIKEDDYLCKSMAKTAKLLD